MQHTSLISAISSVMRYFGHFAYPPTSSEIHTFLPVPCSRSDLEKTLTSLQTPKIKKHTLVQRTIAGRSHFTRAATSDHLKIFHKRHVHAQAKQQILDRFLNLVQHLPPIAFVGISGSMATHNTNEDDDIDLFIITAPGQLWTGRLLALGVAQLLGIRRRRTDDYARDRICLNLFFDGSNLEIPSDKQTAYVGHELLQLRPVLDRGQWHDQLLSINHWVGTIFPNAHHSSPALRTAHHTTQNNTQPPTHSQKKPAHDSNVKNTQQTQPIPVFSKMIESFCRQLQLPRILRHRTTERISDSQLWFFPHDYEPRVKNLFDTV